MYTPEEIKIEITLRQQELQTVTHIIVVLTSLFTNTTTNSSIKYLTEMMCQN